MADELGKWINRELGELYVGVMMDANIDAVFVSCPLYMFIDSSMSLFTDFVWFMMHLDWFPTFPIDLLIYGFYGSYFFKYLTVFI